MWGRIYEKLKLEIQLNLKHHSGIHSLWLKEKAKQIRRSIYVLRVYGSFNKKNKREL
jgi:hypothetical protein